jgi:hypothetical protein
MSTSQGPNLFKRVVNVPTARQVLPPIAINDHADEQDDAIGAGLGAAIRCQPPRDQQQQRRGGGRRGAP